MLSVSKTLNKQENKTIRRNYTLVADYSIALTNFKLKLELKLKAGKRREGGTYYLAVVHTVVGLYSN